LQKIPPTALCATLAVAVALGGAVPAFAQNHPQALPTRDVTVTYRVPQGGGEMRMSWLAAQQLMRMDMPGGMGWMVMSMQGDAARGFMVMAQQRMVMDLPAAQASEARGMMPSPSARFVREGTDRVANTPCTIWRVQDQGEAGRACITADGVTLRAEQVGRPDARMEAIAVVYGAQDATRFQRPQGYQTFQMPPGVSDMMRGTALPPPALPPRR